MELVNTDFQCNGRHPGSSPPPPWLWDHLLTRPTQARKAPIRPSSGESQTSPVFHFSAKQLSGRHPEPLLLGTCNPPAPKAGMPEGQTQPNMWVLGPVKPTAGPLAGFSPVPWNILARRIHGLSNL